MPSDVGAFTETGVAATFALAMAAARGTFTETGNDATLIYGQSGAYTLVANMGAFAETGIAANFAVAIPAARGTFIETGIAAGLVYSGGNRLIAACGVFTWLNWTAHFRVLPIACMRNMAHHHEILPGKEVPGSVPDKWRPPS